VAGHFGQELAFLVKKSFAGPVQAVARVASWILPNYLYFNFRDLYQVPGFNGGAFIGWSALYALCYAGFFLALSALLFSRKEF
jgi:hypothetical protein